MSTNKRPVPPNGSADSETDHIVKKEKLEETTKVKKEAFDQETDEEETDGDRDDSALKQETDDEAEAKKEAAAVKKEPDDEIEADDELPRRWDYFLQRLQNDVKRAIAALKAKQEEDGRNYDAITELDNKLRQAQHNRHVAEKLRREEMYKKNPETKENDQKTFYWCENQFDDNKSFLLLPKLKYYDWRDFRACPTWGDLRSCLSKEFYENVIMKRRNDLLEFIGEVEKNPSYRHYLPQIEKNQKEQLEKSSEDGTPFYCGTTFRKGFYEGCVGDLFCEPFGEIGEDDRFPPYIEQIMSDEYDSAEFEWLDEYSGIEEGGHRFQYDLIFEMKDKDEIFGKFESLGYKTEHEPELLNLTTTVRSNATALHELYSGDSDYYGAR